MNDDLHSYTFFTEPNNFLYLTNYFFLVFGRLHINKGTTLHASCANPTTTYCRSHPSFLGPISNSTFSAFGLRLLFIYFSFTPLKLPLLSQTMGFQQALLNEQAPLFNLRHGLRPRPHTPFYVVDVQYCKFTRLQLFTV